MMGERLEVEMYLRFDEQNRYLSATRFLDWLTARVVADARGDRESTSEGDPSGRFWLGRLGPKDVVVKQDNRGDRMEPCAIGLRLRPASAGPWSIVVSASCRLWSRDKKQEGDQPRLWRKSDWITVESLLDVPATAGERIFAEGAFSAEFARIGGNGILAQLRARTIQSENGPVVEITLVNVSTEVSTWAHGRMFECSLEVRDFARIPFELEALPDSFRFDRTVQAFGINCGVVIEGNMVRTSDAPKRDRARPVYWGSTEPEPELSFDLVAADPVGVADRLSRAFEHWADDAWSASTLSERAAVERWSDAMRREAENATVELREEVDRIRRGVDLLASQEVLRAAFSGMNRAMKISARGKYLGWRPFQFAFLLANLASLIDDEQAERGVVDVVWFATGGGKTETYLGLLVTAALLDRATGKSSGVTAWSRFPLRMLSLQQTQRFANALAGAEIVRRDMALTGDPFSLGFLVGGAATPNRVFEEASRDTDVDPFKLDDIVNPYKLLDVCPFCRSAGLTTQFERTTWRLTHRCTNADCSWGDEPLPLFVVDEEIWRFLPTVIVGTLDKAANIARAAGMRGMLGPPWGYCSKPGHGYTYAVRSGRKNGCLVPGCKGHRQSLPMPPNRYGPSFRLQDELHLLRDSLGAVDAHYEAALDTLQESLGSPKPKILASSATLAGYAKQVDVLYQRQARVFPQPPPREGAGFWTADSSDLMRRFIAVAPRGLTIEFAVDRLVVSLQSAVRELVSSPADVCAQLAIAPEFASFLLDLYGTTVVYGNTLRDLDAVVRSSETQYGGIQGRLNRATLTGRTNFGEVRETLERLERAEQDFEDRIHLVAASSMMSHGVDVDRLNVMTMLGFPLGVAEFIQATARVGRRWPALVVVVPKIARERDASIYRSFPEFVSHGDRFVEAIPITGKSRRVLERTVPGLEFGRVLMLHEADAGDALTTPRKLNDYLRRKPEALADDERALAASLGFSEDDQFLREEIRRWFEGFERNLREPGPDQKFLGDLSPNGAPMTSLRDVEEQVPVLGDSAL